MYKRSFAFLLSLAFSFIFFLFCSEETPLTPEDSVEVTLEPFPFFPLSEDFAAVYKCVSKEDPSYPEISPFEKWQALLRLEVIRTIRKEESSFYKIEKTVLFPLEGYEGDLAEIEETDIDHSRTIVQQYDILYQDSTLWYVDHAPSFEKLDQGIKTLFYISPDEGRSYINLTIFGIPDKYSLKDVVVEEQLWLRKESEGFIIKKYKCYRDLYGGVMLVYCDVYVKAREKTGIVSIMERRIQGMTSHRWAHRYEIELIE